MVTIKQLSERCGLSVSAVSKALNNYPDISEETRRAVHQAAREMGYIPNALARALKTNRTYNIGVLMNDDNHHGLLHAFFVSVLEYFKCAAESRGYDIMFINHNIGGNPLSYLSHCRYRNVDGVFIAVTDFESPEVRELAASGIPAATLDYPFEGVACVQSDNFDGLRRSVCAAAEAGHRRIAFVYGHPGQSTDERKRGYNETMAALSLPVPEGYLVAGLYRDIACTAQKARELLTRPDAPTCLLLPDDYAAIGALTAAWELGLDVPGDVSLIGYDGVSPELPFIPRMDTIQQDTVKLGTLAAQLLIARIEGDERPRSARERVPVNYMKGNTLAPPRGARGE